MLTTLLFGRLISSKQDRFNVVRRSENGCLVASLRDWVQPAHGPVGDKSQLTAYRDMLVDVRSKLANLKKQGRTLKDIVAAKPTATYDANWGGGLMSPSVFTGAFNRQSRTAHSATLLASRQSIDVLTDHSVADACRSALT
jgi:hypothetical protein